MTKAGFNKSRWAGLQVLVLSPTPTHPVDFGNRRRINLLCTRLKRLGAVITFVHYPGEADWRDDIPASESDMSRMWDSYYLVPVTRDLHPPPVGTHHEIDEWWDDSIGFFLQFLTSRKHFDVAIVNYTWLSKAFEFIPSNVLKVLDTHDRFGGRKELLMHNGVDPEYFYTTEADEAQALSRADIVWAIKDDEEIYFKTLCDREVLTVLHAERLELAHAPEHHGVIRFGLAGARNKVNATNFENFLDEFIQYIDRTLLPCEIIVAGSCCELMRNREIPHVRLLGRVDDMDELYNAVDVILAPMTFSTGLKIKVGEALAKGKALICHAHAFEGYVPTHAYHQLSSFGEMLRAMRDVVADPTIVRNLEAASAASMLAANKLVNSAVERTVARLFALKRAVYIVADMDDIREDNLVFEHILETADYIRNLYPIVFFVYGRPNKRMKAAARKLRQLGDLVVCSKSWRSFGSDLPGLLGTNATPVASLTDITRKFAIAVWFSGFPSHDDLFSRGSSATVYLPIAVLKSKYTLSDIATIARAAERCCFAVTIVEPLQSSLSARLDIGTGLRRVACPILWRGHMSSLLRQLSAGTPSRLLLFVDSAGSRLTRLLVDMCLKFSGRNILVVSPDPLDSDAQLGKSGDDHPGGTDRVSWVSETDLVNFMLTLREQPFVVFDAAGDGVFLGLRELITRSSVPVVRLFAPGEISGDRSKSINLSPVGTYASLQLVSEILLSGRDRSDLVVRYSVSNPFTRDAGWAVVWRELKRAVEGWEFRRSASARQSDDIHERRIIGLS